MTWFQKNKKALEKHGTLIDCIGIDDKQHCCYPWSDETICGIKIKSKKVTKWDRINRYGCWECTY